MREACLHNNWSFVPIFLKIYRALMRWTPWSFFGGRSDDESPWWGHSPRTSGGSGVKALSQILSEESLSYTFKHISTGEHSLYISWRSTHPLYLYFLFSRWLHAMETDMKCFEPNFQLSDYTRSHKKVFNWLMNKDPGTAVQRVAKHAFILAFIWLQNILPQTFVRAQMSLYR